MKLMMMRLTKTTNWELWNEYNFGIELRINIELLALYFDITISRIIIHAVNTLTAY